VKHFDYAAPESVGEAAHLLGAHPRALLLAGGTDLIVQLRSGRKTADLVIDLKRISDVRSRVPALNHRRPIPDAVTL